MTNEQRIRAQFSVWAIDAIGLLSDEAVNALYMAVREGGAETIANYLLGVSEGIRAYDSVNSGPPGAPPVQSPGAASPESGSGAPPRGAPVEGKGSVALAFRHPV